MNRPTALAALIVTFAAGTVAAQPTPSTVYRCGPDGRQYSATPCPGGTTLPDDARSREQRRQAEDVAARERELADKLRAERLAREKSIVPAAAGSIGSSPQPVASAPRKGKGPGKGTPKKKRSKNPAQPT